MKNTISNNGKYNLICFCGKSGKLNKTCDGSDWSCVTDFLTLKKISQHDINSTLEP